MAETEPSATGPPPLPPRPLGLSGGFPVGMTIAAEREGQAANAAGAIGGSPAPSVLSEVLMSCRRSSLLSTPRRETSASRCSAAISVLASLADTTACCWAAAARRAPRRVRSVSSIASRELSCSALAASLLAAPVCSVRLCQSCSFSPRSCSRRSTALLRVARRSAAFDRGVLGGTTLSWWKRSSWERSCFRISLSSDCQTDGGGGPPLGWSGHWAPPSAVAMGAAATSSPSATAFIAAEASCRASSSSRLCRRRLSAVPLASGGIAGCRPASCSASSPPL
mmetsp:Transcript_24753/g.68950  ORF Transcript_24753/g.68950 Transcript_24753/m.68950 type:complete len:281 (-) Transcript_24753:1632-2474(-)